LALSDPEVKKEYDLLDEEFKIFKEMLRARIRAGKTQEDIAKTLHTTVSAISRLENAGGQKHYSPSLGTLRKYAAALGCKLQVQLIPLKAS
jgi:transcriptional regulator with XRE-family HTH domain